MGILDHCVETGEIQNPKIILETLGADASDRYPIYHANAAAVGMLPANVCEKVVRFHALSSGVFAGARILLGDHLQAEDRKASAYSLKLSYQKMLAARDTAIAALEGHVVSVPKYVWLVGRAAGSALPPRQLR